MESTGLWRITPATGCSRLDCFTATCVVGPDPSDLPYLDENIQPSGQSVAQIATSRSHLKPSTHFAKPVIDHPEICAGSASLASTSWQSSPASLPTFRVAMREENGVFRLTAGVSTSATGYPTPQPQATYSYGMKKAGIRWCMAVTRKK
ncbi:unnamed protein product [Phytophthora lilii]|uniref:Unnamed protein product n=1 Tax=Phytophthora lilii TaxID=2077276 RepID=A0A9W6YIT2_9STRA|nr:unnamed protein product [Phytophthora lilii]